MGVSNRGLRWAACGAAVGAMGMWAAVTAPGVATGQTAASRTAEDRAAIEQLMTGDYPRALDGRNWKVYSEMWTDDGEFLYRGNLYKGPAAIAKVFDRPPAPGPNGAPAAPPARTMHVVTNISLKIDGDRASGGAYWQTIGLRSGQAVILGGGHYDDELRRVGGRWKFTKRAILYDVPPTVPGAAPAAAPAPAAGR